MSKNSECIFLDRPKDAWRTTKKYRLPYIPELDVDLNHREHDTGVEDLLALTEKMRGRADLQPISLVEAWKLRYAVTKETRWDQSWEFFLGCQGYRLDFGPGEYLVEKHYFLNELVYYTASSKWNTRRNYVLPFIPSIGIDLNERYGDQHVEVLLEHAEEAVGSDLKPIGLVDATILHHEFRYKGTLIHFLKIGGYRLVIDPSELLSVALN